jgi:hypothetical protein
MFRVILIIFFILFHGVNAFAFPPTPPATGATINDSAGNGDTTEVWSADKVFDQLALKLGGVSLSDCSGITSGVCLDTDDGVVYVWNGASVVTLVEALTDPTFTSVSVGNEDTTIERSAAGVISVEGVDVEMSDSNDIDPDRLAGDSVDDNKVDAGIIGITSADLSLTQYSLWRGDSEGSAEELAITQGNVVGRVTSGDIANIPIDDTPEDSSVKVASSKAVYDSQFTSLAVADLSDASSPHVLTTAETTNKCISNYASSGADRVFTMPSAHAKGNMIFSIGDEFQVDIEPASGTAFYLNGTAMANDEHIQNTADTLGERIVGYCVNINGTLTWMFYSSDENFVEETPE